MKSKHTILILMLVVLFSNLPKMNAQVPNWIWAKSIGGTGNDLANGVAVDDSSNIYLTGSFESTVDFDPGPNVFNLTSQGILDVYILKLDSLGNFLWAVSFGGTGTESSFGIDVDYAGNVFVTGRFADSVDFNPGPGTTMLTSNGDKDVFIVKLSTNGTFIWAKSVGGTGDDEGYAISLDNAGFVLISGAFANTVDFDPNAGTFNLTSNGNWDAFVLKLENGGSFIWARSFGGTLNDVVLGICTDKLNNVYSTGYFINTADFDPGASIYNLISNGFMDSYVSKLDHAGNFVWAKNLGGTQTENGNGIITDAACNVYSIGNFQGTSDFDPGAGVYNLNSMGNSDIYVSNLDSSGGYNFAGAFGSSSVLADAGYAIATDLKGNVYTTGIFRSTVDFDPGPGIYNLMSSGDNDGFILKLDSIGNFNWALKIGSTNSDQAKSLSFDKSDHLYLVGNYMSTLVAFGSSTITNTVSGGSTADIFIAKLDSGINTTAIPSYLSGSSFIIYPNPVNDKMWIWPVTATDGKYAITITDITGKIILTVSPITVNQYNKNIEINVKQLSAGIYNLQIRTKDAVENKKFVIAR